MDTPLEMLRRWEDHGGEWRVVDDGDPDRAVVELCTCHGEVVDRIESGDRALLRFLRERSEA